MATTEKESKEKVEERKIIPLDPQKVKEGDLMAFVYYGQVTKVYSEYAGHRLQVKGLAGAPGEFSVNGDSLIINALSADQVHEEHRVTKTRAAELLVTSFNRPLTVCFVKQDGQDRVLRGRLVQPEPLLGRSHVEDLDVAGANKLRLVDHRTIKWLIVEGVKYVVKS